jgi:N-acetyl sugar amidotransferase
MNKIELCTRCVLDHSIPNIAFDHKGECNYCELHDKLCEVYPQGDKGEREWQKITNSIKLTGQGNKYDCIVGVSGGTDSSYLLYYAKSIGLRPLAVYFDNGWGSSIATKNIQQLVSRLDVDLETYVVNYDEMKDILLSYMKASLPWIDIPTDLGLQGCLYKVAMRENIKYILTGNDFRSEGKQPTEWTYGDSRQLKAIQRQFGTQKLRTFPTFSPWLLAYSGIVKKVKMVRPYYFISYDKDSAKRYLKENLNWSDYGGHHHESIFTKYAIGVWLPNKFSIDKRMISYSAQIRSGYLTRSKALGLLGQPACTEEEIKLDEEYLIKKLDISSELLRNIWERPVKGFEEYPSYYPFISRFSHFSKKLLTLILPWVPMMFFEQEIIRDRKY